MSGGLSNTIVKSHALQGSEQTWHCMGIMRFEQLGFLSFVQDAYHEV